MQRALSYSVPLGGVVLCCPKPPLLWPPHDFFRVRCATRGSARATALLSRTSAGSTAAQRLTHGRRPAA
eukprot:11874219-Karenia_brevis.AAC.1